MLDSPDVCTGAKEEAAIAKPERPDVIPKHVALLRPTLRVYISKMKREALELTLPWALPRARSHPGNFPDWREYSSSSRPTPPVKLSGQDTLWLEQLACRCPRGNTWEHGVLGKHVRRPPVLSEGLGSHCQHLPTVNLKAGSNHTTCVEDGTKLNVLTCSQ